MSGRNNFLAKAVCLFMNMDKMVGGQFETEPAARKQLAEAANQPDGSTRVPGTQGT